MSTVLIVVAVVGWLFWGWVAAGILMLSWDGEFGRNRGDGFPERSMGVFMVMGPAALLVVWATGDIAKARAYLRRRVGEGNQ